ncbi:sporulation protein YpjB [Paenibacillus wynnii]|uniref:sporulation protein YpjB n=1 Tax=Paenibacillus wynnii TaxID=268407 RepID=UPI00278FD32C|nr:sporulation protein YpjB [Paenibacillus wynnii]MDQ0192962.1 sporulation protein YpjB [Paenibacillus wynnii]
MPRKGYNRIIILLFCWMLYLALGGVTAFAATAGNASGAGNGAEQVNAKSRALQLEQAAETLYGHVLEGDVTKVRQETEDISRLFVSSSFEGLTSVEGINALSGVIIDLKAAVAGVEVSPERWESAAAKLRLAANSLNHPRQPIWTQYYKLIREDLNNMEKSSTLNDVTAWKAALQRLQSRYDTIRPAVIISRPAEEVNAFDSWLSYAAGAISSSQPLDRARLLEIVSYGQEAVRVLFGKEKDEPALSLPMAPEEYGIWAMLAACFIIGALVYTGYRKYRADKQGWTTV